MKSVGLIGMLVCVLLIVGEIKCIVNAVSCNWEPVGKAEIVYTLGACSGLGCVIGWIDIEDK